MKTNLFKVKKKYDKQVILEEDVLKNPILLFLKKNKKNVFWFILMLLFCLILVSVGLAFSSFRGSNDYDITYITGGEQIESNNDPDIDDEDVEEELLGEIAKEDGVVILVETFMTPKGDVVSCFTDGTSIMVTSKGKIYRISSDKKGNYGISKDGKISSNASKILVKSTTSTLADGSVVTYYTDGTAKLELNDKVVFVRDSDNILIDNENNLIKIKPSGVALTKEVNKTNGGVVNVFSDGTKLITIGDRSFIVNKNADFSMENGILSYDRNNTFSMISDVTYKDGNIIRHYTNGSATITDKDGKVVYVKNSGDLKLKKKKLYEIVPNDKGESRGVVITGNKVNVVYYDNGAAVIIYPDNNRVYVEDSDQILFDGNKNIIGDVSSSKLISVMVTEDGETAYSFENGKSQVIRENNSSYIVDTDTLTLRPIEDDKEDGNKDEDEDKDDDEDKDEGTTIEPTDPTEGIHITEAEHEYDDPLSVQTTTFTIRNNSTKSKDLRIVIKEIDNYFEYKTDRLEPKFVKYQATVGDDYVPATVLSSNSWLDQENNVNYILYDGIIPPKTTLKVALSLYVDYSLLDNSHQNKGFIGTIKVFVQDR